MARSRPPMALWRATALPHNLLVSSSRVSQEEGISFNSAMTIPAVHAMCKRDSGWSEQKSVHKAALNAQISLVNEEVDEGRPGGEDGSLDVALAKKLLSKRALHDELLHPLRVFRHLQWHSHCPTGLVVYLRYRQLHKVRGLQVLSVHSRPQLLQGVSSPLEEVADGVFHLAKTCETQEDTRRGSGRLRAAEPPSAWSPASRAETAIAGHRGGHPLMAFCLTLDIPEDVLFRRCSVKGVESHRVHAVLLHHLLGVQTIVFGLAHLLPRHLNLATAMHHRLLS
ncbi:hypothetical protein EYF80_052629 [Liparis tanakae]|uniref:Uncharacterized protein n=1 Tax=Liparis tanakae TaxID=230148 RepID=A0A4Z2F7I9_9TELE|nr:hypothetical protein EYF80_052629 [Liparis tanakae]